MHDMLSDINKGRFIEPIKTTLGEYLETWLEKTCRANVAERTFEDYEGQVRNHIIPNIGGIGLIDVRPDDIRGLYAKLRKAGLSGSTIRHTHIVLHSAFGQAVNDKDLIFNPVDPVKAPEADPAEKVILTPDEAAILLSHALTVGRPRKRNGMKWLCNFYELFRMALASGMRRGELLALKWSQVDLEEEIGRIEVIRTMNKVKTEKGKPRRIEIKPPKSKRSNRGIPIDVVSTQMLRELHERNPHDLVFCHDDGSYLDPTTVTHKFSDIAKMAGVPAATFHSQRHTYVTNAIEQGTDPFVVQEMAGHQNISTTRIYVHTADDRKTEAARKMGSKLPNSGRQQIGSKSEGESKNEP